MIYLTGLISLPIYRSFHLESSVVNSPRQTFYLDSEYVSQVRVFVYKSFYYKSERSFKLDSVYGSFGKSFDLVGFYFLLTKKSSFALDGLYLVKNYEKYVFNGKYSNVIRTFFRFESSYKRHQVDVNFLTSKYSALTYTKLSLEGVFTQEHIVNNDIVFYLDGSYESFLKVNFYSTNNFYLFGNVSINEYKGNKTYYQKIDDFNCLLATFKGYSYYEFGVERFVDMNIKLFKDIMPLYSSNFKLTTPYKNQANDLTCDLLTFSAEGLKMSDFYGPVQKLTVNRYFVEYEDYDIIALDLDFNYIQFHLSDTINFIYPDIYLVAPMYRFDLFPIPDYKESLFALEGFKKIFKTNLEEVMYLFVDPFPKDEVIELKVYGGAGVELNYKYYNLFPVEGNKSFKIGNLYYDLVNFSFDEPNVEPIFFSFRYFEIETIKGGAYLSVAKVIDSDNSYIDVKFFYDVNFVIGVDAGAFETNKFNINLHRNFYVNEEFNIKNGFLGSYSVYTDVDAIISPSSRYLFIPGTNDFLSDVSIEFQIIEPNTQVLESIYRCVNLSFTRNTSDFLLVGTYKAISMYRVHINSFYLEGIILINSATYEDSVFELAILKVREND